MKRRNALKTLTLAVGGLMLLPACDRWTKDSLPAVPPFLSAREEEVLSAFIDTLIPATKIPAEGTPDAGTPAALLRGARELDVPHFVARMLQDCYEPALQDSVRLGLGVLDEQAQRQFSTPFASASAQERQQLMGAMEGGTLLPARTEDKAGPSNEPENPDAADQAEAAELQGVYALLKGLSIRGYLSSEWVMRTHSDYHPLPGHYSGCVPVSDTTPLR
ncbi:gluconate 2-dehydrogenase subunit 3 family protein [Cesiribacter andamanensis]|uniref:Gluconate 2-dehydrogenase subunit 3 n=1 Tax=Cesiribacter andamanensis AMV16 TaxID=1279009 RepID=M7MWU1_9BACT|nr:gluconate 2-dehydrogenase subunit 3 family protein [Cesiribacter andamanensis]EMR00883.1 hypothetical protein ADICEAN_03995 [Cesiribacter andamanensis AMV16]